MVSQATDIIARVMRPEAADMPPEMARKVLTWQFTDGDRQRVSELLEKNSANTITREETAELETYVVLGDLLDVLHAQAHLSLRPPPPAAQAS